MKRFAILLLLLLLSINLMVFSLHGSAVTVFADGEGGQDICQDIGDLFVSNKTSQIDEQVYLGGAPLGITIDGEGVTVVGLNEFIGIDGEICCPASVAGICINDVIVELDGQKIFYSARLAEIASNSNGKSMSVKYLRKGTLFEQTITPIKDLASKSYRLGLWTRDCSSGVGTLTYVRQNLSFASLGHPICDGEGNLLKCHNGGVYNCQIEGVKRGEVGKAGELKGVFTCENKLGCLQKNNKYGAYGVFERLPSFCNRLISVADIGEIKPGKAQIYCTLEDNVCRSYEIKIVKACYQTSADDKGMVIVVTDKELLAKTGGIVQGMSGSPIVQKGKLVGAVTHVFLNDPTRGYGIYAKWMLEN